MISRCCSRDQGASRDTCRSLRLQLRSHQTGIIKLWRYNTFVNAFGTQPCKFSIANVNFIVSTASSFVAARKEENLLASSSRICVSIIHKYIVLVIARYVMHVITMSVAAKLLHNMLTYMYTC
eukprot:scaffold75788_cov23-Prasinocladus_malaysianus.AAC.1